MFKIILLLLYLLHNSFQWTYNPYCWIKDCDKPKTGKKSFFQKYNPYCLLAECSNNEEPISWSPKCWFSDCTEQETDSSWSRFNIFSNKAHVKNEIKFRFYNPFTWYKKSAVNKVNSNWFCWSTKCLKENKPTVSESTKMTLNNVSENILTFIHSITLSVHCWLMECCNKEYIQSDFHNLKYSLDGLYGQPFTNIIVHAIEAHWNNYQSKKPLILSLHGYISTGKTYASNAVVKSLYKLGFKSSYVHQFIGSLSFQDKTESKKDLYKWISGNITNCQKQLFIFDQIDEMQEDILNYIKPLLDNHQADYSKAIFIFISNIGSKAILEKFIELRNNDIKREDMTADQYTNLILGEAYNKPGGLYQSEIITENVIDHIIPFLPLEMEHVRQCILNEFSQRNVKNPLEQHVTEILDSLIWEYFETIKISLYGCGNILAKVAYSVEKNYPIDNEEL